MKPCSLNPPIDCIGLYLYCTSELFLLCFAPNYQGKSLPHENQPGNTPDQQVCFISIRIQIWLTNLAKVWRTTTLTFILLRSKLQYTAVTYLCMSRGRPKESNVKKNGGKKRDTAIGRCNFGGHPMWGEQIQQLGCRYKLFLVTEFSTLMRTFMFN